jgi:hypothetical protein
VIKGPTFGPIRFVRIFSGFLVGALFKGFLVGLLFRGLSTRYNDNNNDKILKTKETDGQGHAFRQQI